MDEETISEQLDLATKVAAITIGKLADEDCEFLPNLAKATRRYYEELKKEKFTREEAIRIITGFGGAFGKSSG